MRTNNDFGNNILTEGVSLRQMSSNVSTSVSRIVLHREEFCGFLRLLQEKAGIHTN